MSKTRRHFTPEQKAEIVRRHVVGKEPVSNLADEFGLQPSLIHGWVNLVMAQAERAYIFLTISPHQAGESPSHAK